MSSDSPLDQRPIDGVDSVLQHIMSGAKAPQRRGVGLEHEVFGYDAEHRPLDALGCERVLHGFAQCFGWERVFEGTQLIALRRQGAVIALEPGGQLELAGAVFHDLHQLRGEIERHHQELAELGGRLGLSWLAMGARPEYGVDEIVQMPRNRYQVMRDALKTRGAFAEHMMRCTCTVQPNFDFGDQAELVSMLWLGHVLSPLVVALFANSPFRHRALSGYASTRSHYWSQTDPQRTGYLRCVFEPDFGLRQWVQALWQMPVLLEQREGRCVAGRGSFAELLARRAAAGAETTVGDWELHVSSVFPVVRVKRHLEFRSADSVPYPFTLALAALWKGVLYSGAVREALGRRFAGASYAQVQAMHQDAMRHGLSGPLRLSVGDEPRPCSLRELVRELLAHAAAGLREQALGEEPYLLPLNELVEQGSLAEQSLQAYARGEELALLLQHFCWPRRSP